MARHNSRSIGVGLVALFSFATVWLGVSVAEEKAAGEIEWRSDLGNAKSEAKSKRRLLWIQFTGPWCHFCHLMDRESFVNPKVVGQSRNHFVPIKLQSDLHEELAVRLGVGGLPATVLVTSTGEIVAKHEGFVDGETFHAFLESARVRVQGPSLASASRPAPARQPAAPATRRVVADVALAGFCPVSLVQEHRLVPGEHAVSLEHEGRVYRFANPIVRSAFQRQPERFIPVNSGRCPVSQVDRGDAKTGEARFGILYQGHLYLCSDEASRTRFMKNPDRYSHVDLADRGLCPHCWGHDFVLAKGQAQWSPAFVDLHLPNFERVTRQAARNSEFQVRR